MENLKKEGKTVGLAVIIVGDNPASRIYVNNKKKACEQLGIHSEEFALPAETTEEELKALVEKLNNDSSIDGILVGRNSRIPPQLEKNHVAHPSSQDEALSRYSASGEVPR